jgi:hypothetical protein
MVGIYHKFNISGKLRTIVLGSFYTPAHFNFIKDVTIRDPLQRVAFEINQDLDCFQQILESYDITVLRPEIMSVKNFKDFFDSTGYFPSPPLQPRNHHAVLGDQCYQFSAEDTGHISRCLQLYNDDIKDLTTLNNEFFTHSMNTHASNYNIGEDTWYRKEKYIGLAGPDWPNFVDYVNGDRSTIPAIQEELEQFESSLRYETKEINPVEGPNFMPLGNRLVIDCNEYCDYVSWSREHIPGFEFYDNINTTAGHTDGCFVILGKNTIVGIDPLIDYQTHFPEYSLVRVPPKNYLDVLQQYQSSKHNKMRAWFIEGEDHNQLLQEYIDKYFDQYTGFSPETVFDVNVLALDQTNVCITSEAIEVIKSLEQRGINCIHIPWRHRWFVDCGLHCLTLDLHRDD